MTLLSIDELKTLTENTNQPCVSLYMPMQKAGPEIRQNPIRFKNLIRDAQARLEAMKMNQDEANELLQPAMELDTGEFWENQDQGLAIFIAPGVFRYYQLPTEFQELVVVSDRFHIKPLLPLINNDGKFYILALSQQDLKFFEGTRSGLNEVEIENLPKSLDEALLYDETAREGQFRIATSKGSTSNPFSRSQPGAFHGQGSPDRDQHQEAILQFFHIVDGELHEKLREETAPLILAGVDYLHPIYRQANSYTNLLEQGITRRPELFQIDELHADAWEIVEPLFHESEHQAMELYQQLLGEGSSTASSDLKEIVAAAYYQRVDSLFVPVGQQIWGKFDPETMNVDIHSEPEPDDQDLLDFAAIHTILNGGSVYAVEPEKMPSQLQVAAIFRY
ncbi:hypothetical protein ACX27_10900 [Nostoc piscinale CENA21]|uniref:Uncharacterized protein n=1 Tax=Nostoc piscinale CENA21 TaxID=224013 RepID=A0A0M3V583_9NOSO|nr:hypothetical protein [Nostoc piscinale]ALF53237.1 hypothetical protein ACX27_10900 [Nostoc piscinale CENA21]